MIQYAVRYTYNDIFYLVIRYYYAMSLQSSTWKWKKYCSFLIHFSRIDVPYTVLEIHAQYYS